MVLDPQCRTYIIKDRAVTRRIQGSDPLLLQRSLRPAVRRGAPRLIPVSNAWLRSAKRYSSPSGSWPPCSCSAVFPRRPKRLPHGRPPLPRCSPRSRRRHQDRDLEIPVHSHAVQGRPAGQRRTAPCSAEGYQDGDKHAVR